MWTSMTSTPSKSPRSGTTRVCLPAGFGGSTMGELTMDGSTTAVSLDRGNEMAGVIMTVSPTSIVRVPITVPVDIVSPAATVSALMTPFSGDGISMEALSVSTIIRPSSRSTVSPTPTSTSITSTSSKSPRSGTTMSIVFAMSLVPSLTTSPDQDDPGRFRIS